jgi:hypothetical protein
MNLTLTTAELKKLRWLLNVILEDQEQFLSDETEPDARREAERAQRAAEKLLKRLDCPRRSIQVVSTRDANGDSEIRLALVPSLQRKRSRKGGAGIDWATLLSCAEADLLGFLDTLDMSAQDQEHPAAQTVRDLHAALKQIQPSHACSVDNHGGARHLRLRQPQVQT